MTSGREFDIIASLDRVAKRHLVEQEGRVMCWREFGAGAPLILVHGGHGSWMHWIRNIGALSATHRVLVPDLPGYGESDALPPGGGFDDLVDTVLRSIDRLLGADTGFDLAGFSFGGVIAGRVALQRPGVRRLALLGAVGHGKRRRQAAAMLAWRDAEDEQSMLANLRHNLNALMLHGPVDPLALDIHHYSCLRTRYQSKKTSLSPILTETLEQLDMPVLLLWGEHDPTGDPGEVGPLWQADRPERSHGIVRGSGHWVQYEAAGEVNARLLDWFSAG
ncbi:alpha/beta fold hydrolase [Massilia niastensis]|uniref:alpha/beta fold hydrolase n=1 Tax=Massilia niastensis TaxID=544911 RepID=UPI00036BA02C|nr:alpha/beta fold hydrolase [Massilia niastensis]